MIMLYSGTPGSGKSLHTASKIIACSRFGRPVIGNFECDLHKYPKARYTYMPNHKLTPDFLIGYSRDFFAGKKIREGAILLVIDECQLLFNSRDWQQRGRNEWLSFFTQHRKYGFDVILIAQFDRMIDRQIRSLIEYEFIHRKMSNFGIGGKILSLLFGGNTFVAVQMWYPLKLKVGSELFHARKYLYSIYDSYGTFVVSSAEGQKTEKTDVQQLHEDLIFKAPKVDPPKKRRFFEKLFFLRRHPREAPAEPPEEESNLKEGEDAHASSGDDCPGSD